MANIDQELRKTYEDLGQGHVFKLIDQAEAPAEECKAFEDQLRKIDVPLANELFKATVAQKKIDASEAKLEPVDSVFSVEATPHEKYMELYNIGLEAIAKGEVAVLLLAGGQGTRLGFDHPKGMYDIGLPSRKVLFQLQAERLTKVRELAARHAKVSMDKVRLPWYVMTSPMTDKETREFLIENKFFGHPSEDVVFFSQGTLPCFDMDGKFLLAERSKLAEAPDGNGGLYRGMHVSGTVADMEVRGIKHIHAVAVDNAVVKLADPAFIGHCINSKADLGCKAAKKVDAHEKVGVLCYKDGKPAVVEYSDIDDKTAELKNEDGELMFGLGNICIHYYSIEFLRGPCHPDNLPKEYHLAKKQIPYTDIESGKSYSKSDIKEPNGIKLEAFIFDVFGASKSLAVMEIKREDEFSPVKNAPGSAVDSPDSARQILSDLHAKWLWLAGAKLSSGAGHAEVSPLVSYGGEGLEHFKTLELKRPALVLLEEEAAHIEGAQELKDDIAHAVNKNGVNLYIVKNKKD